MLKITSTVCPTVIEFRLSTANYFLMDYSLVDWIKLSYSSTLSLLICLLETYYLKPTCKIILNIFLAEEMYLNNASNYK